MLGVAAAVMMVLADAAVADPWGDVDCEQIPSPSCDVGAGEDDDHDQPGRPPSNPDQPGDGGGGGSPGVPERPPGDYITGEPENLSDCEYVPVDYVPPGEDGPPVVLASAPTSAVPRFGFAALGRVMLAAEVMPPPEDDADGAWYVWQCTGEGYTDAVWRPPVWIPNEQRPDGSTGPSVLEVAQRAYAQLHLTPPDMGVSPEVEQLVQLPTWLWLDPEDWVPISATASVPGVSVTAVATPVSVSLSMGDGGTVTCDGPGTPFQPGEDPAAESPDCGYTYTTPSELYEVSATVTWMVTWSGAGQSGAFPGLTTSSSMQVRVVESQALTTR